MSDETKQRVFVYDGREFEDPGREFSETQVRDLLARTFGALRNGLIERSEEDKRVVFTFKPAPQHKGTGYHTVYTFGYQGRKVSELKDLADQYGAVVVDVRFNPTSHSPAWRKGSLHTALRGKYVHIPEFGNKNYNTGGPIELAHPEKGLPRVAKLLRERPVILLCVCAQVATCHRKVVADLLQETLGVTVVHLNESAASAPAVLVKCAHCDGPAFAPEYIKPPLCERHHEVMLLISQAEQRKLPVTADNLNRLRQQSSAGFVVTPEEMPALLLDIRPTGAAI